MEIEILKKIHLVVHIHTFSYTKHTNTIIHQRNTHGHKQNLDIFSSFLFKLNFL